MTLQAIGWQGYGLFILETLVALAFIGICAWSIVRFGRPRLLGKPGGGRMKMVERIALEPRRSLYLVEVDGKPLLISASEGSVRLIKELDHKQTESNAQ